MTNIGRTSGRSWERKRTNRSQSIRGMMMSDSRRSATVKLSRKRKSSVTGGGEGEERRVYRVNPVTKKGPRRYSL